MYNRRLTYLHENPERAGFVKHPIDWKRGVVNMILTTGDGVSNGWKNHHTADLIVISTEIGLGLFEATSPIGWAFGAAMFVGDLISEHYTGHTITENIFDND
jgi:hypothetical protein